MKTAGSVSYVPELDGLRALAVLAVLAAHYGLGPYLHWLVKLLMNGTMGVWAFFVLSGFLITSILVECRRIVVAQPERFGAVLRAFYARRILRIFPLYYATIMLLLILGPQAFAGVAPWHALFLSNTQSALFVRGDASVGLAYPATAHFWSLSVEEQFYLLWPFCVLLLGERSLSRLAVALLVIGPLSRLLVAIYYPATILLYLPTCVDALGFGALLAIRRARGGPPPVFLAPAILWSAVALTGVCLVCLLVDAAYRPTRILLPSTAALLFAWLIDRLVNGAAGRAGRLLRLPALVQVGRISYGVYLLHTFIADAVKALVPAITELQAPLRFLVLTAATIAICQVIWIILEQPLNALKRHFPLGGRIEQVNSTARTG